MQVSRAVAKSEQRASRPKGRFLVAIRLCEQSKVQVFRRAVGRRRHAPEGRFLAKIHSRERRATPTYDAMAASAAGVRRAPTQVTLAKHESK